MPRQDERRIVLEWRLLCFSLMGYELAPAYELANSDADIRYVDSLLTGGATHEEARRIAL